jgi:hypothetical protein
MYSHFHSQHKVLNGESRRLKVQYLGAQIGSNLKCYQILSNGKVGRSFGEVSGVFNYVSSLETIEVLRAASQKNMVMSPAEPGTNMDCADEAQQQFTRPTGYIQFQLVG